MAGEGGELIPARITRKDMKKIHIRHKYKLKSNQKHDILISNQK